MGRTREFMEHYREAFLRGAVDELLACYGFPLQLIGVGATHPSVSVVGKDDWRRTVGRLVSAYRRLGVSGASTGEFAVTQPLPGVAAVHARWALRGTGGDPIYDFTAIYTIVDSERGLRIVTIAHDELPKITAALQSR